MSLSHHHSMTYCKISVERARIKWSVVFMLLIFSSHMTAVVIIDQGKLLHAVEILALRIFSFSMYVVNVNTILL